MSTEVTTTGINERLLAHFEAVAGTLPGSQQVRREAAAVFSSTGVPTRRTEDYKYLQLETLLKKDYGFRTDNMRWLGPDDITRLALIPEGIVVVIVNGHYAPALSRIDNLPVGLRIMPLAEALAADATAQAHFGKYTAGSADAMIALNTMLAADGVFIHAAKGACVDETPVQIIHIADNEVASMNHPRNLVVADEKAQLTIIETFESIGPVKSFTNALTEVAVAPFTRVEHYRLQVQAENANLVSTVQANVEHTSKYTTHTYTLGGALVRNNLNNVLAGKNCEVHLFGLYLPKGSQVVDNHTIVDHTVPNCMSNELYKGVVTDKGTAVFNGKIFVRPDAQKTNAYQTNKNILLSDDAAVNTKPQLEIYADDVKCSHGTSTGRMDEEALFYLRARGIGEDSARKLLVHAFAGEVVDNIGIEPVKDYVLARIADALD